MYKVVSLQEAKKSALKLGNASIKLALPQELRIVFEELTSATKYRFTILVYTIEQIAMFVRNNIFIIFAVTLISASNTEETPLHKKVDPFIGTGGHGHTYPRATAPFGMVQLSPDTRLTGWDGCGWLPLHRFCNLGFRSHTPTGNWCK